ncbi:MAG TPA: hypothetical protein VFU82_00840 [Gammaproteobacteria bacterium]|nr:hypothetical protein [Gammaproteobacteria bacterium]
MKTREKNTFKDEKLIRWGLNLKEKQTQRRAMAESAEPINNLLNYTDNTLTNLSNLVAGIQPILHISINFLMHALNSIPWISVFLNVLNGIFRAIRSLVIKQTDNKKNGNLGPIGVYSQRIWLTTTGISAIALGLASMFVATLAVPFTIASCAVDTLNRLIKFGKSLLQYFTMPKDAPITEKSEARIRIFFKLETLIMSAISLTGTILLFSPLMPVGAGLLIGSAIYALADSHNMNPFKHLFSFIKNKVSPPKAVEAKTSVVISEADNTPEAKEKRMKLFEAMYCKPTETIAPKKEEKTKKGCVETNIQASRRNPMKLFQESLERRPDIHIESRSFRLR